MSVVADSIQRLSPGANACDQEREDCKDFSRWKIGRDRDAIGPGKCFSGGQCLEKSLFADNMTAVGDKEELEVGIEVTKEVMARFEERNNDGKDFGTKEGGKIRMIGCWMGWKEDVKNRLTRAGCAWFKVRQRFVGSRLLKKKQARVVEACVETALLFDCQV